MTILQLLDQNDVILREIAKPIRNYDLSLRKIIASLELMLIKYDALGIAAPQVGYSIRLILVKRVNGDLLTMCNPEITTSGGTQTFLEGCLSLPNCTIQTVRPEWVMVKYKTATGLEAAIALSGRDAVVFCHELDHLNGVLMIDHKENQ